MKINAGFWTDWEVFIRAKDGGERLAEYKVEYIPSVGIEEQTVKLHVECIHGQEFEICVDRPNGGKITARVRYTVDGRRLGSKFHLSNNPTALVLGETYEEVKGVAMAKSLQFGRLEPVEDGPKLSKDSALGTIVVQLEAGEAVIVGRGLPYVPQPAKTTIDEKSKKGMVSSFVGGVLTNTVAKEVTYMNLVHTAGTPKFKVVFSYGTRASLLAADVIPGQFNVMPINSLNADQSDNDIKPSTGTANGPSSSNRSQTSTSANNKVKEEVGDVKEEVGQVKAETSEAKDQDQVPKAKEEIKADVKVGGTQVKQDRDKAKKDVPKVEVVHPILKEVGPKDDDVIDLTQDPDMSEELEIIDLTQDLDDMELS